MKAGMPGGRRTTGVMGVKGNCSGLCFEVIGNCGAAAAPLLVVLELLEVVLSSRGDAPGTAAGGGIAVADAAVLAAAVLFSPAAAGCGSC